MMTFQIIQGCPTSRLWFPIVHVRKRKEIEWAIIDSVANTITLIVFLNFLEQFFVVRLLILVTPKDPLHVLRTLAHCCGAIFINEHALGTSATETTFAIIRAEKHTCVAVYLVDFIE